MSQTCPECNHEYADGDVFCSSCGTRFGDERATSREVSAGSGSARSSQPRALGDSQEDSDGFIPLPLPPEPPVRFWQSRGRNGVATRWWVVVLSLVLVLLIAGAILGAWLRADDGDGNSGDTGIVSGAQGVVIPTLNLMDTSTPTLAAGEPATTAPAAESSPEVTTIHGNEDGGPLATGAEEASQAPMFTDGAAGPVVVGSLDDLATPAQQVTPAEQEIPEPTTVPPTSELTRTIGAPAATVAPEDDATVDVPATTGFASAETGEVGRSASESLSSLIEQVGVSEGAEDPLAEPVSGDGTGGAIRLPGDVEAPTPTGIPTTAEGE